MLTSRGAPVRAKLDEGEANRVISLLPELGHTLLETVPGRRWTPAGEIWVHGAVAGASPRRKVVESPAVHLRDYRGVVVAPGQIVADDRVLWPDTFRHNARKRLRNLATVEVAPGYARLRFDTDELPVLEGTYFHLDNEVRGHFGHLLTEQVSRMWAWPMVKELVPDLKVLVGTNQRRPELLPYELAVYAAAGIPAEDVVLLREPVRVERLLSASPMFSNPNYVHPAVADTWRRVGDALAATATGGPRPERIFCRAGSRSGPATTPTRSRRSSVRPASRWSSPRTIRSLTRSPCSARPRSSQGTPAAGCSTCASSPSRPG